MGLKQADITAILGPVDETLVAELLATGATAGELAEAIAWVNNDEALIGEGRHLPAGRVAALIDILTPDNEEERNFGL
ncbi:MAG: hypothetical protein HOQ41_09280 [Ensifer adhaerens]|jgi:hypothetical protein|nr:hypothetical protein [Ensifer adhaerens]